LIPCPYQAAAHLVAHVLDVGVGDLILAQMVLAMLCLFAVKFLPKLLLLQVFEAINSLLYVTNHFGEVHPNDSQLPFLLLWASRPFPADVVQLGLSATFGFTHEASRFDRFL